LEPNVHDTLRPGGGRSHRLSVKTVQRKIARIANKFNLDTQKIRFELILELKALEEMAQQKTIDTHPACVETKQNWASLAAYINQVINGISKTFDETKIEAELEELEKRIKELSRSKENKSAQQQ
jgi:predicted transcriptional regulator